MKRFRLLFSSIYLMIEFHKNHYYLFTVVSLPSGAGPRKGVWVQVPSPAPPSDLGGQIASHFWGAIFFYTRPVTFSFILLSYDINAIYRKYFEDNKYLANSFVDFGYQKI